MFEAVLCRRRRWPGGRRLSVGSCGDDAALADVVRGPDPGVRGGAAHIALPTPAWGRPAASRTYADGVHGRIWPSRPSVRRGTFLYASGVSRRRTPSARTLTTWWRWRAGSPVDWTQETHAYQVPSRSCLSQHSRWPIAPPVISTMGGDQGVRAYSPPSCAATRS